MKDFMEKHNVKLTECSDGNFWVLMDGEIGDEGLTILQCDEDFKNFVIAEDLDVWELGEEEFKEEVIKMNKRLSK